MRSYSPGSAWARSSPRPVKSRTACVGLPPRRLAEQVTADDLQAGSFYPSIRDLRRVSVHIAESVVREARECGVGRDLPDQSIGDAVAAMRWDPNY